MTRYVAELSEENLALATAEVESAVGALGGRMLPATSAALPKCLAVDLADESLARGLADRLALSRRVLRPWPERNPEEVLRRTSREGASGASGSFRPWGHGGGGMGNPVIASLATAWRSGGGSIDLAAPERRFWVDSRPSGPWHLLEEVARVDRRAYDARRMPKLPFQRPVSLAPRLARAAANLAGIRPGDRVVDPFVGTGALVIEAGLLGGRLTGVDRAPEMVKGTIRNLAHVGLEAEALFVADAAEAAERLGGAPFDAVLTDPPYGRASGSHGEPPTELLARVLPLYARLLRPSGRLVVVMPGGADPVGPPFERVCSIPDRVHRSLTREFRVYARAPRAQSGDRPLRRGDRRGPR